MNEGSPAWPHSSSSPEETVPQLLDRSEAAGGRWRRLEAAGGGWRWLEASDSQLSEVAQQGRSCSTGGCWLEKPTSCARRAAVNFGLRCTKGSSLTVYFHPQCWKKLVLSIWRNIKSHDGPTTYMLTFWSATLCPCKQTRRLDPPCSVHPCVSARLKRSLHN